MNRRCFFVQSAVFIGCIQSTVLIYALPKTVYCQELFGGLLVLPPSLTLPITYIGNKGPAPMRFIITFTGGLHKYKSVAYRIRRCF